MRSAHTPRPEGPNLRRLLGRLDGLPLRPAAARFALAELPDAAEDARHEWTLGARWRPETDLDPGWALAQARGTAPPDPLALVADRPWWPPTSREGADALVRLWRHDGAVSLAARRLAREANDPNPEAVARAGLLHGLGRWAVAALDPEWVARWLAEEDANRRRERELRDLGAELSDLGRALAERWGCEPLVADANWLLDESVQGLSSLSVEPGRLALLQDARRLADGTPWSLRAGGGSRGSHDPRVKVLIAEVQSRCPLPFADADPNPREEQLTRSNARLRIRLEAAEAGLARRDRFLNTLTSLAPSDAPEVWAERAGLAWCEEPGVSAARVGWEPPPAPAGDPAAGPARDPEHPPALEVGLTDGPGPRILLSVWTEPDRAGLLGDGDEVLDAWKSWAAWVADRQRFRGRLESVLREYRSVSGTLDHRLRAAKLDALAEFAAGAGHELNNPLAVIVGRAQLLLVKEADPEVARSLRTILAQAQRAHRILRDLMYVARPPEPRPRYCQPDEIVRACVRDVRDDAEAREVRVVADPLEHGRRVWADPDGLRHLADSLVRNALEATPAGGQVRFRSAGDAAMLSWEVEDTGRGLSAAEGEHLFDPFFCGRQAGRGLGLGLPRSARFVALGGGEVRYHSTPGQGSTFSLRLPLTEPPKPPGADPAAREPGVPAP